jgi:hypothetical protein
MGPQAFRDGIFSDADPMSRYGTLQTAYSDGTLGQTVAPRRVVRRRRSISSCQRWCVDVNTQYGTPGRIKPCNRLCNRYPRRHARRLAKKYKAGIQMGLPATRQPMMAARKKAAAGMGQVEPTTMAGVGIGLALVAGLVVFGASKKKR